jgi:uncharacterized protein YndB with AHSA1/START domain
MTSTRTLSVALHGDREVRATRRFDAPRPIVFTALTTPHLLKRWMHGPNGWRLEVCDLDLRVGGAIRYVWRKADGREMGMSGTFLAIDAPDRFVHTERFDDDWTGGETVVTNELREEGAATTLTVTIRFASPAARDAALATGFAGGMEAGYDTLAGLLAADVVAG